MRIIVDYARLILFVGGALIGVQVPSFVDQYEQRLEAHLIESKTALNEFQKDADKFFGGDVEKLVQHYQRNDDPVFNDGGKSIASLVTRHKLLSDSIAAFKAQFYSPYVHTLAAPVTEIRNETWRSYDYAIKLNLVGIAWALAAGFILALFIDLLLSICRGLFTISRRAVKQPRTAKATNTRKTPPEF